MYEPRTKPVASLRTFVRRLGNSLALAVGVVALSLGIGMTGYRLTEGLGFVDSFLESAMLLGGMGPVTAPKSEGGKIFAGLYALYCGLVVILIAGLLLTPVLHRVLHKFHADKG
jgi:hypothetical protein